MMLQGTAIWTQTVQQPRDVGGEYKNASHAYLLYPLQKNDQQYEITELLKVAGLNLL